MYTVIQHEKDNSMSILQMDGTTRSNPAVWKVPYNQGLKMKARDFKAKVKEVFGVDVPKSPTPRTKREKEARLEAQRVRKLASLERQRD